MAFSALVSLWPTTAETYPLLRVVQNPPATDVTIYGEISPTLKSEMRAVLLQLCDGTNTVAGRAAILLDALDDLVVTDLDDNVLSSQAAISGDNTTVTLTIAGTLTRTLKTVYVVMPQSLVGIYAGSAASPGDILLQTGVVPGTYTNATITVRADGRISVAESGIAGGGGGGSLSAGSITSTYLATGAVTTDKIANSAVTDAKIAGVSAAKVTGLSDVATSGSYSDLSSTPDLSGYLTSADVSGKLDSTTAASTYLSQSSAASTYLTQSSASSTYATKTDLTAKLDSSTAASTYATKNSVSAKLDSATAASTYLAQADAASTYLAQADAASTYATQSALSAKLDSSTAASTYLAQADAASTYLAQADAASTYAPKAVPYDIGLDYALGAPALNEVLLELPVARALTFGAPASHAVKTLDSGERPSSNNGFVLTVYRNSTAILTVSYQTNGTAAVAEPDGTSRSFSIGDVLKVTCTTADSAAKDPKITFSGTLA